MKRSVTDTIRRGFDNVVANWQLLLIRIAEGILFVLIAAIAIIAAIVPMALSVGLNTFEPKSPDEVAEFILGLFFDKWMLLVYLALLFLFLGLVYVTIHAFVEAGCARTYVDAERANAANPMPARQQFRFFTAERWFEGAKRFWWPVFWIFNATWGVGLLIITVPLLVTAILMLLLRESPAGALGVGCVGLIISVFVIIGVSIVTYIWCEKAIVVAIARDSGAVAAMSASWSEFKTDAARHLGVTIILFILLMVGQGLLSTFGMAFGWNDSLAFNLSLLPLQVLSQLASTVFSAFMTSWFLACFAALSVESRG